MAATPCCLITLAALFVGAKIAKVRLSFILAGWYSPETVSTPNSFKSVTILASNKVFPEPALPIIATSLFFF